MASTLAFVPSTSSADVFSDIADLFGNVDSLFGDVASLGSDIAGALGNIDQIFTNPIGVLEEGAKAFYEPLVGTIKDETGIDVVGMSQAATSGDFGALLSETFNASTALYGDVNTVALEGYDLISGLSSDVASLVPGVECAGDLEATATGIDALRLGVDAGGQVVEAVSAVGGVFSGWAEAIGIAGQVAGLGLDAGSLALGVAASGMDACAQTYAGSVTIKPLDPASNLRDDDPGNLVVTEGDVIAELGDVLAGDFMSAEGGKIRLGTDDGNKSAGPGIEIAGGAITGLGDGGASASTGDQSAIALGSGSSADNQNDIAIGSANDVSGGQNTAVGNDSTVTGTGNVAVADGASVAGDKNVGLGSGVSAIGDGDVVLGLSLIHI